MTGYQQRNLCGRKRQETDNKQIDGEQLPWLIESSLVEDKVDKKAAKVYTRLEEKGVCFGVSNQSSGQLTVT